MAKRDRHCIRCGEYADVARVRQDHLSYHLLKSRRPLVKEVVSGDRETTYLCMKCADREVRA
jgi:hypothetical protein